MLRAPGIVTSFLASLAATIAWVYWAAAWMMPLTFCEMMSFGFAGTTERAAGIMMGWYDRDLMGQVNVAIYLDLFFILLCCVSLSLGCRVLSEYSKVQWVIRGGHIFSWSIWIAGMADLMEKICMRRTLSMPSSDWAVSITYLSATLKSVMLAFVMAFILVSVVAELRVNALVRKKPSS
jgi:hypothetical protein